MKKITLLLLLIGPLFFGQNYIIDNSFNPSDTGIYRENIGKHGKFLNNGKILTIEDGGITRLNSDGSTDNTFNKIPQSTNVNQIFAEKELGTFIAVCRGNTSSSYILKYYNADGTLNTSFTNPVIERPNNSDYWISKVAFLNDGKFLVIGLFSQVNGVSYNNLVRLNNNGSIDTTFNIGTGFDKIAESCAIQSDGKYIIGGDFLKYNGNFIDKVVRLETNGTIDTSFRLHISYANNNTGTAYYDSNGPINDIVIQPDGKIITSGANLKVNGSVYKSSIVRLNTNGAVDKTFELNIYSNYFPEKLLYTQDGSLYFHLYDKIIKCNNSGVKIDTFNDLNYDGGLNGGDNSDLALFNNKLLVVGNYRNSKGITRLGYHRLNLDGSIDLTFNPCFGFNSNYFSNYKGFKAQCAVLPDNKILVYGDSPTNFTTYNDIPVKSIIRLTENGELDTTFNISPTINSSMLFSPSSGYTSVQTNKNYDGSIYIKGNSSQKPIVKLNNNGTEDTNFNFPYSIETFKITDDNKIIASGKSDIFKSETYFKILRFNSDFTIDNSYTSPLFTNVPIFIELLDDGKSLISFGYRTAFTVNTGGQHLVRLNENGSIDNTFIFNSHNEIYKTKTINDKIYVSDGDTYFGPKLIRYNFNGSRDTDFTPIPINISTNYMILPNGVTITSTNKADQNYEYSQNLYKINNSSGTQISQLSLPTEISSLTAQNCANILVSGRFFKANNTHKKSIYRLKVSGSEITSTPTADTNQSFSEGQTLADLNVNGQNIKWFSCQNNCVNSGQNKISNQTDIQLPNNTKLINNTTYYASQTINGIESNHRLPVTVNQLLSNSENQLIDLKIYPNPTENYLTISNLSNIEKLELYNLTGQKIFDEKCTKTNIDLNLSDIENGIYILKIFSEGKSQTNKIIKQ